MIFIFSWAFLASLELSKAICVILFELEKVPQKYPPFFRGWG
jgi:hypothetical protein